LMGGWSWVVWGIFVRVSVCVTGHWLVGHFAHRKGGQTWVIDGASAQGYNVKFAGLISMGEGWHNNHHAFPSSPRMRLFPGQSGPGGVVAPASQVWVVSYLGSFSPAAWFPLSSLPPSSRLDQGCAASPENGPAMFLFSFAGRIRPLSYAAASWAVFFSQHLVV